MRRRKGRGKLRRGGEQYKEIRGNRNYLEERMAMFLSNNTNFNVEGFKQDP